MKKIILLATAFFCFTQIICAQYVTPAQYIAQYKDIAIREMKRMGVPAAISLAQGLLETENGNSELLKRSNNHFGIKCKSSWTAEGVSHDDDAPGECFRVYKNAEDSYRDHSNFLRGGSRYAFLFKLDPKDYKGWAYGLRKAGYATNPKYPDILIKNIEDNNLEQYTLEAAGEVPVFDASKYTDDTEDKNINDVLKSTGQNENQIDDNIAEPSKVTINGSKALYVNKGTSLLVVASQNNINLSRLLEINDLQKDGLLEKDQYIFLEKKQRVGSKDFYIVQPDETLYDVAQKNGIMLQSLYDFNGVAAGNNLQEGTKIFLRPQIMHVETGEIFDAVKESAPQYQSSSESKIHEVQPKESLYAISKKYGVPVEQLKEWNNLKDNNLRIGQQLIISK
ncbi:MAG: LysM peptidoglycan-binding domain-containing protein [Bacteroidota bacterium]|nr:LysM peptidoglycan-binding domain-containing protein [Bacteroidota bacterium]